jgi:hypothetical protein
VSRFRAVVCFSLLLAVASISVAGLSFAAGPSKTDRAALRGVNFISSCRFSHRAPDDPIVFPGQPGRSHDHTFVGNATTSASSSLASLLRGATTCRRAGDTAGYWMPTLLIGGGAIEPRAATIYYRRRTLERIQAFPPGLRVIAGDARATVPQPMRITYWNCGALSGVPPSSTVPTCPNDRRASLRLHVTFPSCWNGVSLDSADHQSHMAYPRAGRCPMSHPVAVPAITLIYRYPVAGGADAALASGGQYSAHADFFNAWDQQTLASLVEGCLNALRHCARGT